MPVKAYHVVPALRGGWSVRKEDSRRASATFSTKEDAIRHAVKLSKSANSKLYVHKQTGMIADRRSFASNPQVSARK